MPIFSEPRLLNSARWRHMRVGILGGSFNPPHMGHVHISKMALKTLQLDAIWWLVTPQNPLKSKDNLLPHQRRIELSQNIMQHPKIIVTGLEAELSATHTYGTVKILKKHFPHTQFCWITGMDNAHTLHKWNHWRALLGEICMVHITRHPPVKLIKQCPVRLMQNQRHIVLTHGQKATLDSHTTYWLLQKKMVNISSTEIRDNQNNYNGLYRNEIPHII
jgi:nicotinate-nucleotide adenylyltransferase